MRGQTRRSFQSFEGKGEVIEVTVRPVPLSILDQSEELLQSGFWGHFKQEFGWQAHPFEATVNGARFNILVLSRRVLRLFSIAYVPFGPAFDPSAQSQPLDRGEFLARLAAALRAHLPRLTVFLRFDLPWEKTGDAPEWRAGGSRILKARYDMQPPSTVMVDISFSEERILAGMKPKTRYNIKLAAKKGVGVREAGNQDFDAWYALYQETGRRDRIAIHSQNYYRGLLRGAFSYAGDKPSVKLLLARYGDVLLAGNIVLFWKRMAVYLTGASSGEMRDLMPTYALQWEAIRLAKKAGCAQYDLYGIPPKPDPAHPMYGLYQFKTGFSDKLIERWGSWDSPNSSILYFLYRAAEGARMILHRGVRKRLRIRSR